MGFVYKIFIFVLTLTACLEANSVNIQHFSRSNSLTFEMLEDARTDYGHVYNDYDFIGTLGVSYVDSPLIVKNKSNSEQTDAVIESMYSLHLGLGLYLKPWWQLGATTSYSFFDAKTKGATKVEESSIKGFSDIELKSKLRFLNRKNFAMSIAPLITIPLKQGTFVPADKDNAGFGEGNFLSDDSFGLGARFIAEYFIDWGQFVLNLGYKSSPDAQFESIDMRKQIYTGIGAFFPLHRSLGANIEWAKIWPGNFNNEDISPSELYLGLSGASNRWLHFFAGVGIGNFLNENDGNDYRISAGFKVMNDLFSKDAQKPKKTRKPVVKAAPVAAREEMEIIPPTPTKTCKRMYVFDDTNLRTIQFASNSYKIEESVNPEELHNTLRSLESRVDDIAKIEVIGHTSATGPEEENQRLSYNRAVSIANHLITKTRLTKKQVVPIGRGEKELLDYSNNARAHRTNRRVEFKVTLNKSYREICE